MRVAVFCRNFALANKTTALTSTLAQGVNNKSNQLKKVKIMAIQIEEYKNNNTSSKYYGKYYGRTADNAPISLTELAEHMAAHNTPYSPGCIKGVLTDMVSCIRHLLLEGINVKIDDLAIFKCHIQSSPANTLLDYDLNTNVKAIRLVAQATGQFTRAELTKAKSKLTYGTKTKADREAERQKPDPDGNQG